jgi:hypothetical protein
MWLSVWHPALFIAKEDVQLEVGGNQQLIEKGPSSLSEKPAPPTADLMIY